MWLVYRDTHLCQRQKRSEKQYNENDTSLYCRCLVLQPKKQRLPGPVTFCNTSATAPLVRKPHMPKHQPAPSTHRKFLLSLDVAGTAKAKKHLIRSGSKRIAQSRPSNEHVALKAGSAMLSTEPKLTILSSPRNHRLFIGNVPETHAPHGQSARHSLKAPPESLGHRPIGRVSLVSPDWAMGCSGNGKPAL